MKRKALGRGLSALIPDSLEEIKQPAGDYFLCPIERIRPCKDQPRKHFDDQKLEELVASIREQGVVQPLVVRPISEDTFSLVIGERRWRAAQKAGLREVPVVIRDVDPVEAFEIALVENLHRADLNPIEEADAFQRLISDLKYTQEQLADRLGKDRSTVTNTLRLLKLPLSVQKALRSGAITPGHARPLLALDSGELIEKGLKEIISKKLSVRQTEQLVKRLLEPSEKHKRPVDPNVRDLEERLSQSLKTAVRLHVSKKGKGRIEIKYTSFDDLDRLLEIFFK